MNPPMHYGIITCEPSADDVGAAHTLAQLHHYGLRGVSQNLTLALALL